LVAIPRRSVSISDETIAVGWLALSLAAAVVAPTWLLLLSPLLLGVPHVAADVEWLIVRPRAPVRRIALVAIAVPLATMTILRAATLAGARIDPRIDLALGAAAIAGGVLSARATIRIRLTALVGLAALAALATMHARLASVLFAHAHNVVAFAVWIAWSPRPPRAALFAYVIATLALLAGLAAPLAIATAPALDGASLARTLAPDLAPAIAARLVAVYAFAQAVHYAVWLHLAPRARTQSDVLPAPRRRRVVLAVIGAATLVVLLAALRDAAGARTAYLSLAMFHGWLELAILAHLGLRRV
jgi:hypothetical protein